MLYRPISLIIVICILGGCAVYHPEPISPAKTAETFESRRLDDPRLREFLEKNLKSPAMPWPPESWDISALTLAAFFYNNNLDVARSRWEVAQAEITAAGERPNPSLSFIPQYDTTPTGNVTPWILDSVLNIPIETAGKRDYRIARAKNLSEAARLEISSAAWNVRNSLRASLLGFYAAEQKVLLSEREIGIWENLVELTQKRLTVGESSRLELIAAGISLDRARLALGEAQKRKAEARVQIADSIGIPLKALDGVRISFEFVEEFPRDCPLPEMRRRALAGRTDILSALARYEANQNALQLEIARQYPDIVLGPGYKWDEGENKWSIGFSVVLPVFNQNQGGIARAEARRKESYAAFTALQGRIIADVDLAAAAYNSDLGKLDIADRTVEAKKTEERAMSSRLKVGQADRMSLLSAGLELVAGRQSRLDALVSAQQSLGLLESALQQPLASPGPFPAAPFARPRNERPGPVK